MPYHVKSTGAMGTGNIYYEGGDTGNKNCWTGTYADRKQFSNKSDADAIAATQETRTMKPPSGTIVSTYTYELDIYKNSTVVTE